MFAMLFSLSSCDDETKTYEQFYVTNNLSSSGVQTEVSMYVAQRCKDLNAAELGQALEQSEAENKFQAFCAGLADEIKNKGYKVFADTWVGLQLQNLTNDVIADKKVDLIKTADPKYYVWIVFTEIAPTGDTDKATKFIEEILKIFSLTKETKTENGITSNVYSFYKEYSSAAEAENYYQSKEKDWTEAMNKIEREWPADIIYTGKVEYFYRCVDEFTGKILGNILNNYYVVHKPGILGTTWTTTSTDAPFTSIQFMMGSNEEPTPIFVSYKATIDGKSTDYRVIRAGNVIGVTTTNGAFKYMFRLGDANHFTLIEQDGAEAENAPVYTLQAK